MYQQFQPYQGSSPLARGAHRLRGRGGLTLGIIPACAGSTDRTIRKWLDDGDHPRLRGEHRLTWYDCPYCGGSSPLARGAR